MSSMCFNNSGQSLKVRRWLRSSGPSLGLKHSGSLALAASFGASADLSSAVGSGRHEGPGGEAEPQTLLHMLPEAPSLGLTAGLISVLAGLLLIRWLRSIALACPRWPSGGAAVGDPRAVLMAGWALPLKYTGRTALWRPLFPPPRLFSFGWPCFATRTAGFNGGDVCDIAFTVSHRGEVMSDCSGGADTNLFTVGTARTLKRLAAGDVSADVPVTLVTGSTREAAMTGLALDAVLVLVLSGGTPTQDS